MAENKPVIEFTPDDGESDADAITPADVGGAVVASVDAPQEPAQEGPVREKVGIMGGEEPAEVVAWRRSVNQQQAALINRRGRTRYRPRNGGRRPMRTS